MPTLAEAIGSLEAYLSRLESLDASVIRYHRPGDDDWSKAFERAASAKGVVLVPPGNYEVNRAKIPFGTAIIGNNATIVSEPNNQEFHENFILNSEPTASRPTFFTGLRFKGNLEHMDWNGGVEGQGDYWHLEHRCAIRLKGTAPFYSPVIIQNCQFSGYPGDGVYCRDYVHLQMCNCHGWNVFRGLVTIGGQSRANLSNLVATGNENWPCGIYFETHGRKPVDVQMNNIAIRGRFKVECTPGSRILCNNVRSTLNGHIPHSQNWSVTGSGDMVIANSYFEGHDFKLSGAGNMLINNCQFRSFYFPSKDPPNGLRWRWDNEADRDPENQLLQVRNSHFKCMTHAPGSVGLLNDANNEPHRNNRLVVHGCTVEGYDRGMQCIRGANWDVRDTHVDCKTPFKLGWKQGSRGIKAYLGGIMLGPSAEGRPVQYRSNDNVKVVCGDFYDHALNPVNPIGA